MCPTMISSNRWFYPIDDSILSVNVALAPHFPNLWKSLLMISLSRMSVNAQFASTTGYGRSLTGWSSSSMISNCNPIDFIRSMWGPNGASSPHLSPGNESINPSDWFVHRWSHKLVQSPIDSILRSHPIDSILLISYNRKYWSVLTVVDLYDWLSN